MRSEDLLDAIGEAKDEYIADVTNAKVRRGHHRMKWIPAIAVCLVLVMGIGLLLDGFGGNAGPGGDGDRSYHSYYGPVLPLTVQGDAAGISASRNVDFDFSAYSRDRYYSHARITDSYVLTNESGTDRTVCLVYPFVGEMKTWENWPDLTVDGVSAEAEVIPGTASAVSGIDSFSGYEALLSAGSYLVDALADAPALDQTAYVYRLHDYVYSETTENVNPTLCMSFRIDRQKTYILSYGMNGGTFDDASGYCSRHKGAIEYRPDLAPEFQYPDDAFVIVLGEDLKDYQIQGYRDSGCDAGEELEDLGCTVTRYETTLEKILRHTMNGYLEIMISQRDPADTAADRPDEALYLALTAKALAEYGAIGQNAAERYDIGMLEDIYSGVYQNQRVIYLRFDVTIPAGASITVEAAMDKEASVDYGGRDTEREGYDLATRLGSELVFAEQTASVSGCDGIEIVDQNFGFDLSGGITEVLLDPQQEHYWLQVRKVFVD